MQQFEALLDFWSPETQSQYVAGLVYTARSPDLERLVEQWVEDGMVRRVERTGSGLAGRDG